MWLDRKHNITGELLPAQATPLAPDEAPSAGRAVRGRLGAVGLLCSCSRQAPVLFWC